MFGRRPGKTVEDEASAYSRRSAATDSLWLAQDRARSGIGGFFGRVGFGLQERLIWPLQDRSAAMGAPARVLSGTAAVVLAAGALAAGLLAAGTGEPSKPAPAQVAVNASAPTVAKTAPPQQAEPTLQGAAPVFEPSQAAPPSEVDPAKAIVKAEPAASAEEEDGAQTSSTTAGTSSAKAPEVDGPPAGREAIAVAREFADAFVLYETGETDSQVRTALAATATPALSRALLERPPRLPANVEVPQAKVVNVVPAPSHGDVYPLSVSLLRVGVTSELRIDMEQRKGEGWRVTNVLG
ncbi:MAG TPA: hypothetical protein VFY48_07255 [Solirubrobacterales bacterium]|nr:hypothetical protein [Solirubrobacterales bacterium]